MTENSGVRNEGAEVYFISERSKVGKVKLQIRVFFWQPSRSLGRLGALLSG